MYIDPNDECFQLGYDLYKAQCLHADVIRGEINKSDVVKLIENYCKLINDVGMLRSECIDRGDKLEKI